MRRTKTFNEGSFKSITRMLVVTSTLFLISCVGEISSGSRKVNANISTNNPAGLGSGESRVLLDNPTIILGRFPGTAFQKSNLISSSVFVTDNSVLQYPCGSGTTVSISGSTNFTNCIEARKTETSSLLAQNAGTWGYSPDTKEFQEVTSFYHSRVTAEKYFTALDKIFTNYDTGLSGLSTPLEANFETWYNDSSIFTPTLKVYSNCDSGANGSFSSATNTICLGDIEPGINFSDDPTITQHEMGHYLLQTMFNSRTVSDGTVTKRLDFGGFTQSERDILSEGMADWFSHYMTGRNNLFEWIGRLFSADRPMREDSELHASFVTTDDEDRVKYPDYIKYDAYEANFQPLIDDAHFGGQIISHFLLEMQSQLVSRCQIDTAESRDVVLFLIQETLAELGDLTALGNNSSVDPTVNMTSNVSDTWANLNNPINIRKFAQVFAKNVINKVSFRQACGNNEFDQDDLETVLDKYGLLLFRTYNEDGNSHEDADTDTIANGNESNGSPAVNPVNRTRSLLVSKNNLVLNPDTPISGSPFFIIDAPDDIRTALINLVTGGIVSADDISDQPTTNNSGTNGSDLDFASRNLENGKIGPGEIVGIALDLKNNANVPIAGVEVLANPWDHTKEDATDGNEKLCNTFEDGFPLSSEGAASADTVANVVGNCDYVTRENGLDGDAVAPICFVFNRAANETQWVSQKEFIEENGIDSSMCLEAGADENECLFRPIPGVQKSSYSIIDPGSTWQSSFDNVDSFDISNVIFFEVNNITPPGTVFNCRFRARFTNCDDCWHDDIDSDGNLDDDYLDFEYAGDKPFRIFNVQFTVLD